MNTILSEGTGRYRRNTIIVSFVLILIWLIPGTDFSGAGFFGIKISTSDRRAELWVVNLLLLVLLYQLGLFFFYGYLEFAAWLDKLAIPRWAIGALFRFGIRAREIDWAQYKSVKIFDSLPRSLEIHFHRNNDEIQILYTIRQAAIADSKRGILIFALIDLAIPTALAEWAIILSAWRILSLICVSDHT